jgi:hypothetical protein
VEYLFFYELKHQLVVITSGAEMSFRSKILVLFRRLDWTRPMQQNVRFVYSKPTRIDQSEERSYCRYNRLRRYRSFIVQYWFLILCNRYLE